MKDNEKEIIVDEELGHFGEDDLEKIKDEETKNWLRTHIDKAWVGIKKISKSVARETVETIAAAKILLKILSKSEVSDKEVKFLKDQSIDLAKALTLIGLQAVPGSSVGIVALESFAKSKGFTIFPKAQDIPDKKE